MRNQLSIATVAPPSVARERRWLCVIHGEQVFFCFFSFGKKRRFSARGEIEFCVCAYDAFVFAYPAPLGKGDIGLPTSSSANAAQLLAFGSKRRSLSPQPGSPRRSEAKIWGGTDESNPEKRPAAFVARESCHPGYESGNGILPFDGEIRQDDVSTNTRQDDISTNTRQDDISTNTRQDDVSTISRQDDVSTITKI